MLQPLARDSSRPDVGRTFRALFDQHAATVWRALRHFGVGEREIEDAAQEVFVVAHRLLSEGIEPDQPRAWLYGIAWRVAAAWRRKAQRRREVLSDAVEPEPDSARDPARAAEARQRLQSLERALAELPDEQRAVFVMYEIEELTMREIASALEVSINTAFSRLYASRRKVAESLGVQVPEEVWKR